MALARRTALALGGLLLATLPTPALAVGTVPASGPVPADGPDPAALSAAMAPRPGDPAAGMVARVTLDDRVWRGTIEDPVSGRPVAPNAAFRIGSINKTFVATVVLQLAAEHRIDLDGTVQQYLPGLLPEAYRDASGQEHGFRPVTVRQLLDHTSGLPQAVESPATDNDGLIAARFTVETLDEVARWTLHPKDGTEPRAAFLPGAEQEYNNFNYRLAGLVIERMTGHSIREEVTARLLGPLGLRHTEVTEGRPEMPEPHLTGRLLDSHNTPTDVSEQGGNPESMVSTPADLDRFLRALLSGELLPSRQQHDLFALPRDASGRPVPYHVGGDCQFGPDKGRACYSAGLMTIPLEDGTPVWGKTGHDLGYSGGFFATADLRRRLVYSAGTSGGTPAPALRLAATVFGPFAP